MTPLVRHSRALCERVESLSFCAPVHTVYNPLVYARGPHEAYLERYGQGQKEVLLVGMNPGPFGMAQTGVPFGEVSIVRDWLGLEGPVGRPVPSHPARPIEGFACRRSEVSGARLWGWARERFGTTERFFSRFFVVNYCPLLFLEDSGRNRTPDKLPRHERDPLILACDEALRAIVSTTQARFVIGVGRFAHDRARAALVGAHGRPFAGVIGTIPHPSPASPAANRGWTALAEAALAKLGVTL